MNGEGLHWLRPEWFLALLPWLGLVWQLRRATGLGRAWAARLADPHLLPHLLQRGAGQRASLPLFLLALGGVLAVTALAGPVWQRLPQPLYQSGATRVVVLDLSYSMNARDLAPSRLERARLKLLELLKRSREGEVALIAYAGEPHLVAPLTRDAATLAALVPVLAPEVMPVMGSRPALALELADQVLETGGHPRGGEIVLITDGIDEPGAVAEGVRVLQGKGRRFSILGVGTPEGAPVPRPDGGFFGDAQGRTVLAKLEEPPLRQLAQAGGGVYASLSADSADLESLLAVGESSLLEHGKDEKNTLLADQWREEGPWLVALLLPLAALAFRRGWLGGVVLGLMLGGAEPAQAFSLGDPWRTPDQQGAVLLEQGEAQAAAERFADPAWQGTALYRAGEYAQAAEKFAQRDDADAHYNRGNALARLERLEEAAQAYASALKQAPGHEDARHNLELVKKLIEQKKEQEKKEQEKKEQEKKEQEKKEQEKKEENKQEQDKQDEQKQDGQKQDGQKQEQDKQAGQGGEQQDSAAPARQDEQGKPSASGAGERTEEPAPSPPQPLAQEQEKKTAPPAPQSSQAAPAGETKPQSGEESPAGTATTPQERESDQATRQWLRRIPEDPGGLLRQKFSRQAQRRLAEGKPSYSGQPW